MRPTTPLLCDWATFGKAANTFHNTPPCWAIYMAGLNIRHMIDQGGVEHYSKLCDEKSKMLYDYIDNSDGFYKAAVNPKYRSRLNVPFKVNDSEDLAKDFVKEAAKEGLIELGGHRSVGGCRASLYNAMPVEGVKALIEFMKKFAESKK